MSNHHHSANGPALLLPLYHVEDAELESYRHVAHSLYFSSLLFSFLVSPRLDKQDILTPRSCFIL
jgi:hypothetical protein